MKENKIKVVNKKEYIISIEGKYPYMINEVVFFKNGEKGIILKSTNNVADVAIINNPLSKDDIKMGDTVTLLGKSFEIKCSKNLFGSIINVYGQEIHRFTPKNKSIDKYESNRQIFQIAKLIYARSNVENILYTGTAAIDWTIPIAKGQRELILGDRKTGKTAIALNMILTQKHTKVKCIYVAIGQKKSNLISIAKIIKENNMDKHTLIIAALADDNATNQYLTPYIGMSIAEHLQEHYGDDVLIIFDDLSKHADAYRELALLFEISPTREAYPSDVFYLHSSLLERAGSYSDSFGGGSITAIPIVQTENQNISTFIPTNVISITDGQIFTSKELFNSQQRPAINIPYSVSRVGSIAQSQIIRKYSKGIKLLSSRYVEAQKMQKMSSFLSKENQEIIKKGKNLNMLIKQEDNQIIGYELSALLLILMQKNYFDFLTSYEDLTNIKKGINDILLTTQSGQKLTKEFIKKEGANNKLIDIFIELEIAPMIKHILLNRNWSLEKNKHFIKIYGNIRNESRILTMLKRKEAKINAERWEDE